MTWSLHVRIQKAEVSLKYCVVPENVHTPLPHIEGIGDSWEWGVGVSKVKKFKETFEAFRGVGGLWKNPFSGGGMDNLWNYPLHNDTKECLSVQLGTGEGRGAELLTSCTFHSWFVLAFLLWFLLCALYININLCCKTNFLISPSYCHLENSASQPLFSHFL